MKLTGASGGSYTIAVLARHGPKLAGQLERRTMFLFYSESGLSREAEATLHEAGVLILDPEKLARYETPAPLRAGSSWAFSKR